MHRGRLLEEKIRKSGIGIKTVADRVGVVRVTLYNWFTKPDLDLRYVVQVGEAINYDFSIDISELKEFMSQQQAQIHLNPDLSQVLKERNNYLNLWTECQRILNEKNNAIIEMQRQILHLEKQNAALQIKIK